MIASTPAGRRYKRRAVLLSLAYAVCLLGSVWLFKHRVPAGALAWIVAILPALPIIGMFAALGRYLVEETDEYQRTVMVRQLLWASGFALSISTAWGFLESFDVVSHVQAYSVAILWFAGLGLGSCVQWLTDRRAA